MEYSVSPKKQNELAARMKALSISERDIDEKFIRSQGKGGQNVNKTATCVYLRHIPTGIEVKCQQERSQVMNRFLARRLLADKIEARVKGFVSAEQQRIEKIRRQKRKRSKRAQEKVLHYKKMHADKKALRAPVSRNDEY